ncbi:MAG: glycosyltransferase family 2 protein [Chloroflexi bacterium]|nr:glycosyltransferase family 2 protein [Chloroflexota bacterium]
MKIAVIIPALNEQAAIGRVVSGTLPLTDRVIVADNGSTDQTAARARGAGAQVVLESRKGYGFACLRAIREVGDAEVIVFMDGDYSDYAQEIERLVKPIAAGEADMVIGSRIRGHRERGALLPHAFAANIFFSLALRLTCGLAVTDIGPFRAIRADRLFSLEMQEGTFGWTLEMMIKAARRGLRVREVPVSYRKRIGHSKVSGSLSASLQAGAKMLQTTWRYLR